MRHATGSLMVLLVLAIGCGRQEPVAFEDGRFQITKPASWSIMDDLNDDAAIQMGSVWKEAYLIVISEPRSDFPSSTGLEDFGRLVRDGFEHNVDDSKSTRPTDITINGAPGQRNTIEGKVGDVAIRFILVTVMTTDHFHQILVWSTLDEFSANTQDFERAIASFRELGSQLE